VERKKILVTGASGFVGGAVVDRLDRTPHEVHCLVRRDQAAALLLSRLLTAWAGLTGKPPLLPLDLMRTQFRGSLLFDGTKAERELGIHYTPIREALREAVEEARERIARERGEG
jgi:nucleoside-diphosphate-sugar epimerase